MATISAVHGKSLQLRDETAYMLGGLWMVTGLYIDGWSHQVNKPETFFTPWHGVLYSGFAAVMIYSGLIAVRDAKGGAKALIGIGDDRITALGLALFGVGAVGDFLWHTIVGIEVDIEGLISPTHLLLMIGGLLMVTLPLRSALRSEEPIEGAALVPVVASATLALAVVSFFLMYLLPWNEPDVYRNAYRPDTYVSNLAVQHGMAMVLVSTAMLTGALLWAARHWRLPAGSGAVMFTAVALGASGLNGFHVRLPILAATMAGVVADVLLGQRRSLPIVGMATGASLWVAYFALEHIESGVGWGPSLWGGAIVFATMTGLAMGLAVSSGATRSSDGTALGR